MPIDYERQAATYDRTRRASPTVMRLLADRLGPGGGRSLLDVAGGTGNYAAAFEARGFGVTVADRSPAMLRMAVGKLGRPRLVAADASRLPFADRSFAAVAIVSALHQFADQQGALAEARRVLRDDGALVIQAFTKENLAPLFVSSYFPGSDPPAAMHMTVGELEDALRAAGFGRVEWEPFVYLDTADGSLAALHTDALALAGPAYLRNTSFFNRLGEEQRRDGLARLAEDLRSGRLEERVRESLRVAFEHGHGSVFAARP